jgi:hypothetical protein
MIALAVLAGTCSHLLAQNALGDGRALDNSLSTLGRYNQARPNLATEFAFRNSVVTGNAPGGFAFRGELGYVAPGEFTGELGSNDLFAFRRDSLRSGMAGMGIRGTEALQYQLALTTGNRPPQNLVGRYALSRGQTAPSAGDLGTLGTAGDLDGLRQRPATDPDADTRGTMLWMLRSPSAYISNSSLQTSSLRQVQHDRKGYALTASPLRGVRLSPLPDLVIKGDAEEEAEAEQAPAIPPPTPASESPIRTMHQELLERLSRQEQERQGDVFNAGPTLNERMETMMRRLGSPAFAGADDGAESDEEPGLVDFGGEDESAARSGPRTVRFDPQTMRLLRGDGTAIENYVSPADASRDIYTEQLRAGQELMAKGRYFDAEERFAHALGLRRGDITAQMGRLHAQLGAGLFLSASLNLQSIVILRPEVFAAKYGPELLPGPERMNDLATLFREMIDDTTMRSKTASPQVRQTAGLLLGYLGYQMNRPELVREGIADFRRQVTLGLEAGAPLPLEARIADLLAAMWIEGPAPGEPGDE